MRSLLDPVDPQGVAGQRGPHRPHGRERVLKALGPEIDFIVPELTMAPHNPAMSRLIPLSEAYRSKAFDGTGVKVEPLAERLAA